MATTAEEKLTRAVQALEEATIDLLGYPELLTRVVNLSIDVQIERDRLRRETAAARDPNTLWEEVMSPLADSPLWSHIRRAGTMLLEADRRALFPSSSHDDGISSSDINHTIFGVARQIDRVGDNYPARVLSQLVREVENYS